jgi:predicted phage terminase large subunit-like protein
MISKNPDSGDRAGASRIQQAPDPAAARLAVSQMRRAMCEWSLLKFAQTYLPHHFVRPPSAMHHYLFSMLDGAMMPPPGQGGGAGGGGRGLRLAVAAPRAHAKSTIVSLAYPLWCACYGKERFIILASDTQDQAKDQLVHVKRELEDNERLQEDFPEACERPGIKPGPKRWAKGDLITRSDVRILALGSGSKIRGRRAGASRPGLIIVDDLENDATARSPEQRDQRHDWLLKSVLPAGAASVNVVVVGTILQHDSVLARLIDPGKSPGWTGRIFRAIESHPARPDLWDRWEAITRGAEEHEGRSGKQAASAFYKANSQAMLEGTAVLWPQAESYEQLRLLRMEIGAAAFDAEKQNEPTDPDDCVFSEKMFQYWDDQHADAEALIASVGSLGTVYGACDPSMGKAGAAHDDTAIVTLLYDSRSKIHYVLDADIRKRRPDDIVEAIIALHAIRRYSAFGVETVQFQEMLKDELVRRAADRGRSLSVKGITHSSDKVGRIQALEALISAGKIRFSRRHQTLIDQLRRFPHAAHDDGPDALEMAVKMVKKAPMAYGYMFEEGGEW